MTKHLDARIQKSQTALIKSGMTLLSKNSEATLSEIAQQAGVGRTTLYRLYETKEQLIKAIAVHCLETFNAATEHLEQESQSALHAFQLMIRAILPLSAEMEFLMKLGNLAQEDPQLIAVVEEQQQEMTQLVELAKAEGSLTKDMPTAWVVNLAEGLLYTSWIAVNEHSMALEEVADLAFKSFCHGVAR